MQLNNILYFIPQSWIPSIEYSVICIVHVRERERDMVNVELVYGQLRLVNMGCKIRGAMVTL